LETFGACNDKGLGNLQGGPPCGGPGSFAGPL